MGENYEPPKEYPAIPIPERYVWLEFLKWVGWTDERVLGAQCIISVFEQYLVFCLRRQYGQLNQGMF